MRRIFNGFSVAVIALALVAMAVPAEAQFARAGLTGQVTDPDNAALPGVTVTIENQDTGATRTTVSGANGSYQFNGLVPGTYMVTFSLQGFQTIERPDIRLRVGTTPTLDMTMQLGSVEETVTVTAQTPLVETTSKEVGGEVDPEQFEQLPSQGRSFIMFARLLPGVNTSPDTESTASDSLFINGQDDNNNSFNVDGAANDDDAIGGRAGAQTRTALDAIQELQILTTQFDAEFGRTQGGVINAVTKSGGNEFHGSAFLYRQDSTWNAKNFFTERNNLEQPSADFQSIGGTLGGPIIRDRLHFFGSFERLTPNEGHAQSFGARPDLNYSVSEDNILRNLLGKIDWQATSDHKVSFRYLREYSPQKNQIIGDVLLEARREEDDTDQNYIGSVDSVLGDTSFNNLRFSYTEEDVSFANPCYNQGNQDFATQRACDVGEGHPDWTGGTNTVAQSRINKSYQIDDTFSIFIPEFHGDHDVRTGFNYSRKSVDSIFNDVANGFFFFDTDADFDPNVPETYPIDFQWRVFGPLTSQGILPSFDTLGLFVQNDWQPSPNLTLNLGLRYDVEDTVDDSNNIAPRLGFSWDPVGDGRTVIRGGYGRFYERTTIGLFDGFVLDGPTITQGFQEEIIQGGTNKQFFVDFAQDRGITTLNGLRDALIEEFEAMMSGTTILNTSPTVDNDSRMQQYADNISVGVEREIAPGVSLGVDLIRTQNREILHAVDLNPFGSASTVDGSGGFRPDISVLDGAVEPRFNSITTFINGGESNYTSLQLQAKRRVAESPIGRLGGTVSYSYSNQSGDSEPIVGDGSRFQFQTTTGYNFDDVVDTINGVDVGTIIGEAPDLGIDHPDTQDINASWHRDHIFTTSWQWQIPGTSYQDNGGLLFSGIWEWRSGNYEELFGETFLTNGNRDLLPAGTYDCNIQSDICFGSVEYDGKENGLEGDDFNRVDMSFRYIIPVRQFQITVLGDVFNILNTTNFSDVTGSSLIFSDAFLVPDSAFAPREFQLGARLDF